MHLSREIDELLDGLTEQKNKLGKEKGKSQKILAEIKEIKAQIKKLTLEGVRARGIWTDLPEFTCRNIFR
jgi:peptidoglycan hydrolase CwlO-like protein